MSNHIAVLLASIGLFGMTFQLFGFGGALATAGVGLFVGAVGFLIDFPDGDRGSE